MPSGGKKSKVINIGSDGGGASGVQSVSGESPIAITGTTENPIVTLEAIELSGGGILTLGGDIAWSIPFSILPAIAFSFAPLEGGVYRYTHTIVKEINVTTRSILGELRVNGVRVFPINVPLSAEHKDSTDVLAESITFNLGQLTTADVVEYVFGPETFTQCKVLAGSQATFERISA